MFQVLGYFKEYYSNNKFLGTISTEKDREEIGYYGKKSEVLLNDIYLDNKKKIKKGTEVQTIIYPINGRSIK